MNRLIVALSSITCQNNITTAHIPILIVDNYEIAIPDFSSVDFALLMDALSALTASRPVGFDLPISLLDTRRNP